MANNTIERAAARQDRDTYLNWKPARGFQMAHALVDATVRSPNNGPVQQRVAINVRSMK